MGARADARRNAERILDAAAAMLATDPAAGLGEIARRAGVSRATLYHHFSTRDGLLAALTDRSIAEVQAALETAEPGQGTAITALERVLRATWKVIRRYGGVVLVNQQLPPEQLSARLEPALAPLRALIVRGQGSGEFDPELPADWTIGTITDLIHAASRQVTAGMEPSVAEELLLRTATAALSGHLPARPPRGP